MLALIKDGEAPLGLRLAKDRGRASSAQVGVGLGSVRGFKLKVGFRAQCELLLLAPTRPIHSMRRLSATTGSGHFIGRARCRETKFG